MNEPLVASPASLPAGARLGRYQILRRLARGGMAELYLARQTSEGGYEKVVALKRVLPHLAEDVTFVEMFLNEAKLAAGLDHSNIAHVVDFGSEGGEHFMVMEYVHGRSVLQILRESPPHGGLPRACALTIVAEVAAALHYAHERAGPDGRPLGLVHRDVSPSNILVSFAGDVRLVDFGIAKATAHTRVTRSGAIKGKLSYMAPEQVRGEGLDRRADVFALSVVAYEVCTGQRCFVAPGEFALINRVAAGRYDRPSSIDPEFPPALEAILTKGLSVDPADRFATARQLQQAIEGFAAEHGIPLSNAALAEHMSRVFGDEAYPTTATLLPSSADGSLTAVSPHPTDVEPIEITLRTNRAKRTAMLAGGALVAGLVLGIGIPRLFADDEPAVDAPTPREPSAEGATLAAPRPSPAAPAAPAADETDDDDAIDEDTDEATIVIEDTEPAASDDPAGPGESSRKSRPRKNKRRTTTPDDPPPPTREYLPPSRRGG